jgi:hypothetical protein
MEIGHCVTNPRVVVYVVNVGVVVVVVIDVEVCDVVVTDVES